jgi:hypothetical protein
LLEHLQLVLPCNVCGTTYTIPASLVRDSQQAIADGCYGIGAITCDAEFYAGLLAPEAIAGLDRAWEAFRQSAEHHGGLGVALVDAGVVASPTELDRLALQGRSTLTCRTCMAPRGHRRVERRDGGTGGARPEGAHPMALTRSPAT